MKYFYNASIDVTTRNRSFLVFRLYLIRKYSQKTISKLFGVNPFFVGYVIVWACGYVCLFKLFYRMISIEKSSFCLCLLYPVLFWPLYVAIFISILFILSVLPFPNINKQMQLGTHHCEFMSFKSLFAVVILPGCQEEANLCSCVHTAIFTWNSLLSSWNTFTFRLVSGHQTCFHLRTLMFTVPSASNAYSPDFHMASFISASLFFFSNLCYHIGNFKEFFFWKKFLVILLPEWCFFEDINYKGFLKKCFFIFLNSVSSEFLLVFILPLHTGGFPQVFGSPWFIMSEIFKSWLGVQEYSKPHYS